MPKIDELIADLCPEGVPRSTIGELCKVETGKRDANEGSDDGQYYFFTTAEKTGRIDTYRWDCDALLIAGNANIGNVKQYNGKFDAYQRTYVLTSFRQDVDVRYLYFALSDTLNFYLDANKNVAAMTYIVLKTLVNFEVSVPHLAVQHEIVSILDKFTQLEAELEAELEARRSQYEHTRDQLLDFSGDLSSHPLRELLAELCPEGVAVSKLDDLGVLYSGLSGKSKSDFTDGNAPFVSYLDIGNNSSLPTLIKSRVNVSPEERQNEIQFGDLLFTGSSEDRDGVGLTSEVEYSPGSKTYLNSFCFGFRPNDDLFVKGYLKHLFRSREVRIAVIACSNGVTRINISKKSLVKTEIPIPPLEVQREIVSILDKLDALVNDLTFGLPAEITARRKQYEYYRNKLLAFKELETA
jgi:type I restriction enzyme S subunit